MSQKSTDQVSNLKEEHQKAMAKLQEEVETLTSSVAAKTEEVTEKNKTLLQVRISFAPIYGAFSGLKLITNFSPFSYLRSKILNVTHFPSFKSNTVHIDPF